jgi:hypothetical protein
MAFCPYCHVKRVSALTADLVSELIDAGIKPTDLSPAFVEYNRRRERRAATIAARQGQLKKAKLVIASDVVRADLSSNATIQTMCEKLHAAQTPTGSLLPMATTDNNDDENDGDALGTNSPSSDSESHASDDESTGQNTTAPEDSFKPVTPEDIRRQLKGSKGVATGLDGIPPILYRDSLLYPTCSSGMCDMATRMAPGTLPDFAAIIASGTGFGLPGDAKVRPICIAPALRPAHNRERAGWTMWSICGHHDGTHQHRPETAATWSSPRHALSWPHRAPIA